LTGWLLLSRAECRAFVRSQTNPAVTLQDVPDVPVTLRDSLAAGNCRPTSEVVAGWFSPRTEVPARELARMVRDREPTLLPFALRAISHAAKRA